MEISDIRRMAGAAGAGPACGAWTAILLAGDRPGGDPLAAHFGVESKALVQVAGCSMLSRVAGVLLATPEIGRLVILAQDPARLIKGDAADLALHPRVSLARSGSGIAPSIAAVAGSEAAPWPVLVTTADHALLTSEMVGEFLSGVGRHDLAVGFGERHRLLGRYPSARRTWLKFADGDYSGANLFALRSGNVADALALWAGVESDRKRAWKVFASFGPVLFLRAATRSIGLVDATRRAGLRLGIAAAAVVLSAPEAAIDVDKLDDFALAEAILMGAETGPPSLVGSEIA